ncbi:MAG TPA: S53 family peptidase, partial [bacterium]|nr:S53 family peptidase [bacterium]
MIGVLAAMALLPALVQAAGRQVLKGQRSRQLQSAAVAGDVDGGTRLRLAIGLPHRDEAALQDYIRGVSDPRSPLYRRFLRPRDFTARFGPSESDYRGLATFLGAQGLRVVGEHANRAVLDVEGAAADVEKTFHVRLRRYHRPEGGTFMGPDSDPSLDVDVPVAYVAGLDDEARPAAHGQPVSLNQISAGFPRGGSGPNGLLLGSDFRNAYAPGVALDGSGQSVALVELANYYPADVASYQSLAGLSTTVQPVYVDGAGPDYPPQDANSYEPTMDIDMVCAMAPRCTVLVYTAPNSCADLVDVLNRIASDDNAQQVSSSWYLPSGGPCPLELQAEEQFAAQGQTYVRASGDSGSAPLDAGCDLTDPLATLVGGTDLTMQGNGSARVSETVWNDATGASQGGILTAEAIPAYQTGMDVSLCQGSTQFRNFPDVSAVACNIFMYYNNGNGCSTGGTSASAPLWCGFMALVNQRCGQQQKAPIGFANPVLYQLAQGAGAADEFRGVVQGNNGFGGYAGYPAVPGYNLDAGWGSMNGQPLI